MKKTTFALTYTYEGVEDSLPYATTLAVSDDREKIVAYMNKCVEEDCREPINEDYEWDTDHNYSVIERNNDEVKLKHRAYTDLYASYKIKEVDIL